MNQFYLLEMDSYAIVGSTSGIISLVGVVGYGLYKLLSHSHCKSACCAKPLFDLYVNLDEKEGGDRIILPINGAARAASPKK